MEEEALVVHVSKMTREDASGYAKSAQGFMNFRKCPPFLQGDAVLVDGKPHTCPQPAALVHGLTCTTALPLAYMDTRDSTSTALLPPSSNLP